MVENLVNMRHRTKQRGRQQRRRMHGWYYAQLRHFLTYKAEAHGCTVVAVDLRHTSQRWSRCGYHARTDQRARGWFRCCHYGYDVHADLNAAYTIAAK